MVQAITGVNTHEINFHVVYTVGPYLLKYCHIEPEQFECLPQFSISIPQGIVQIFESNNCLTRYVFVGECAQGVDARASRDVSTKKENIYLQAPSMSSM